MKKFLLTIFVVLMGIETYAQDSIAYRASLIGSVATGDFAPYLISSLRHGKVTQKGTSLMDVEAVQAIDRKRRLSWGFGVEFVTGYTSKNNYSYWSTAQKKWIERQEGPSLAWVQQFYGEGKYRGVFLSIGAKNHGSALLNNQLSSGDLVESGNSRPIPEVRTGFIDFQDIPFTNGWVQIQGEISYGKMMDNDYLSNHYNHFSYHLNIGSLYTYKRCYFRTKPTFPVGMTIGMQVGGMFGGTTTYYSLGKAVKKETYSRSLRTFFKMFLPMGENGEDFYTGTTLGSWDLQLRYTLPNQDILYAYVQKPWEDGSSIGLRNKTDGLWGLEYRFARPGYLTAIVFELLDFRDQGGPLHWAPSDFDHSTITTEATGRDNYYNNNYFNSYAYFGMSIGTPFFKSPIYNLDGYPAFTSNRVSGMHVGAMGQALPDLDWRMLFSYQRGLGLYNVPFYKPRTCTSLMVEASWRGDLLCKGLGVKWQLAFDAGSLRGNNFGSCITISYSGITK